MTSLHKAHRPVKRTTVDPWNNYGKRRRLIVMLGPGDIIAFREERCRKIYTASLPAVFRYVVGLVARKEKAEALERKKQRRLQ